MSRCTVKLIFNASVASIQVYACSTNFVLIVVARAQQPSAADGIGGNGSCAAGDFAWHLGYFLRRCGSLVVHTLWEQLRRLECAILYECKTFWVQVHAQVNNIYKYHHSANLYWKISRVSCHLYCYKCAAQVTLPTATNGWFSILWWYDFIIRTFDFIGCSWCSAHNL